LFIWRSIQNSRLRILGNRIPSNLETYEETPMVTKRLRSNATVEARFVDCMKLRYLILGTRILSNLEVKVEDSYGDKGTEI